MTEKAYLVAARLSTARHILAMLPDMRDVCDVIDVSDNDVVDMLVSVRNWITKLEAIVDDMMPECDEEEDDCHL